jgi:hypothetical protein
VKGACEGACEFYENPRRVERVNMWKVGYDNEDELSILCRRINQLWKHR